MSFFTLTELLGFIWVASYAGLISNPVPLFTAVIYWYINFGIQLN